MARIADHELEQLKRQVNLQRLVEAKGVKLRRHGADLIGLCPLHDDHEPSLVVSPRNNLWHCLGACQSGGSVIDWVMKAEGLSFRHAVELLRTDPSLAACPPTRDGRQSTPTPKHSSRRKLAGRFEAGPSDAALMARVVDFYHRTLKDSAEAQSYLASRGLESSEMIEHFALGLSDRTLGYRLPPKNRKEGAELRSRLEALGVYRTSGHEHLRGSLVVPLFDADGQVVQLYGRKIGERLRKGTPLHLYLPGPHRGLFNREAFSASEEIILCESLIDALTFWCAGLRHVSACYGVGGFTAEHREALGAHGTRRVYLAFDRDEAGDRGAEKLAAELGAMGIEAFRVRFPHAMDANEYALKVTPASESLSMVVRQAEWMGQGKAPARTSAAAEPAPSPLAAEPEAPAPASAQSDDGVASGAETSNSDSDEVILSFGERRWRIRGRRKNGSGAMLRVNLLVSREGAGFHIDTLELYSARQRTLFVKMAAEELGLEELVIKRDLGRVLLELEQLQEQEREQDKAPKSPAVVLSEREREAALAFLRDPKLVERILADFNAAGIVGERTNKLVGYLSAVSRKLDEPLAVIIQSSSAAGKSSLMEAILSLVPEEDRVQYSAMTGQSLFYMGEQDLKHRILAIVEEEGAERASYALKLLQSEGKLTIASTGKDPTTGRLVTEEYKVEGPVMIMLTTTAIDVDEELLNRCLVLTVDEGREQTRAIHARQRRAQTLAGMLEKRERQHIRRLHQNAQRLLRPLVVVNPFAESLGFADHKTRTRRDHMKYLTLMRSIALLHQHQRPVLQAEAFGERFEYIEVTEADIALADELSAEVLARSIDELPPQTRRLLTMLSEMVSAGAEAHRIAPSDFRFSRRQVRELSGWGLTQLRVHLGRLVDMEYLVVHRGSRGSSYLYELTWTAADASTTSSWRGSAPNLAGGWRALGGAPPRQQNASESAELSELGGSDGVRALGAKTKRASYPKGVIPLRR